MKNIQALFKSIWSRLQTMMIHAKSKNIVKCGDCRKFLHVPKNPIGVSHSLCLKCAYNRAGGTIPRLPRIRDLRLYKSLLNQILEVRDAAWNGQKIHRALFDSGRIQAKAQLEMRSLDAEERNKIYYRRTIAYEHGYNRQYINTIEMQGAGYGN